MKRMKMDRETSPRRLKLGVTLTDGLTDRITVASYVRATL